MSYERTIEEIGKHLLELGDTIFTRPERSCIIVGSTFIEEYLERAIKKVLHGSQDKDDLLGINKPVGTFYAKILLAWRMGLVDDEFKSGLEIVRNLRNDFAHNIDTNIDLQSYRDRILALSKFAEDHQFYKTAKTAYENLRSGYRKSLYATVPLELFTFMSSIMAMNSILLTITTSNQTGKILYIASFNLSPTTIAEE